MNMPWTQHYSKKPESIYLCSTAPLGLGLAYIHAYKILVRHNTTVCVCVGTNTRAYFVSELLGHHLLNGISADPMFHSRALSSSSFFFRNLHMLLHSVKTLPLSTVCFWNPWLMGFGGVLPWCQRCYTEQPGCCSMYGVLPRPFPVCLFIWLTNQFQGCCILLSSHLSSCKTGQHGRQSWKQRPNVRFGGSLRSGICSGGAWRHNKRNVT